jgi:basic amino acid/polyamine antiporter, APA family
MTPTTEANAPDPRPEQPALPRVLGATSAAAVMIGLMIGSGIFRVPSVVAAQVGEVGAIGMLWVLGGLMALFGSLTIAELACMYPRVGGVYVFLREAYGPLPAFLYGWTRLLLLVPASVGAISLIFASYLDALLPGLGLRERWVAGALILTLTVLNYRSLLWGARLENALTAAKVLALAVVAGAVFGLGNRESGALAAAPAFAPSSWSGFGLAMVTVMWSYSGWSSVAAFAGEVKDPGRTLPRAIVGGIVLVIGIYLATNAAYLYVLPVDEMAGSSLVAAEAATRVFGTPGSRIVAALVVLSTVGAVQAALMFNPRIFYAMATDGLLFGPVGLVHRRFLTPHVATVFTALLGIAYLSVRSFEQLAQAFILGVWPFHILMVWAVFRLRRTKPDMPRPYRTAGFPVTPAIFLLASGAMIVNALVRQPGLTLFGFGLIIAGTPFYLIARRTARKACH